MSNRIRAAAISLYGILFSLCVAAETVPPKGLVDSRIRVSAYNGEEVYKLRGFVGYQIDIEFEPGEIFAGLGAGDIEGLSFVGQDNHLFLKPKAARVATNLTVLTSRRHYQFDYTATSQRPAADDPAVIYALRFTYPPRPRKPRLISPQNGWIRNWKALRPLERRTSTTGTAVNPP